MELTMELGYNGTISSGAGRTRMRGNSSSFEQRINRALGKRKRRHYAARFGDIVKLYPCCRTVYTYRIRLTRFMIDVIATGAFSYHGSCHYSGWETRRASSGE